MRVYMCENTPFVRSELPGQFPRFTVFQLPIKASPLLFSFFSDHVKCINVALGKTVTMSSLYSNQSLWSQAVDGDRSGDWYDFSCASTNQDDSPWMLLDLGTIVSGVTAMQIVNRVDCCRKYVNY